MYTYRTCAYNTSEHTQPKLTATKYTQLEFIATDHIPPEPTITSLTQAQDIELDQEKSDKLDYHHYYMLVRDVDDEEVRWSDGGTNSEDGEDAAVAASDAPINGSDRETVTTLTQYMLK